MQIIERHGGGSHWVRPDRVYRTGVLVSTSGFQPNQDVQAVAASFTEGGPNLGLRGLAGAFGAAGNLNFLQRLKLRVDNAVATAKAKLAVKRAMPAQAQAVAHAPVPQGRAVGNPFTHGMAYAQIGAQVAPQMISQVQLLAALNAGHLPGPVAQAQVATSLQHWDNLRWRG